ncbi:MAG TPA: hypothetical protein PK341_10270 [Spirochaetota bacterium]|nr:hypothetical protein [Spirochaetota bacterium]
MPIWKCNDTIDDLKNRSQNTLVENIGIEYIEIGDDYIRARMPVDHRTKQPLSHRGHGGV